MHCKNFSVFSDERTSCYQRLNCYNSQLPLGRQTSTPLIQTAATQISPSAPQFAPSPKTPRTPGPEELKLQEETKSALKELQEEFNLYRREKNKNEQYV